MSLASDFLSFLLFAVLPDDVLGLGERDLDLLNLLSLLSGDSSLETELAELDLDLTLDPLDSDPCSSVESVPVLGDRDLELARVDCEFEGF